MNIKIYFVKYALLALVLFTTAAGSSAQAVKSAQPRQEKLLNGLKLLMWTEPATEKATVKLRVHSGAAFDTLGKEGTMALLADALFPSDSAREFFSEDLGGSLSVESNYDYIQINASGKATQILPVLETLAAAITKPQIDRETTDKIRQARLERIRELEKNPSYVADLAAAKRLFGSYPYGRSAEGTAESLAKIDFADLLLAKQRFLTADNATLAVSGNIKPDYVFKAVRQLFGGWEKSDKRVPATFAQPDAPDATVLTVKSPDERRSELRVAFRGVARNDRDFWAATILARILSKRFDGEVRQNSNLLPSIFTMRVSAVDIQMSPAAQMIKAIVDASFNPPIKTEEFAAAKELTLNESRQKNAADYWLDVDTYKIASVKADAQTAQDVALADVQRVAERIRKEPMAMILMLREEKTSAPND